MKDEDRRDNFLLYNPIHMNKLKDNYTVPAEVSMNSMFFWHPFILKFFKVLKKKMLGVIVWMSSQQ